MALRDIGFLDFLKQLTATKDTYCQGLIGLPGLERPAKA
jgi:hypothetical protein